MYLAVDANFKLKGKDRKLQDIELMPGQGIFVEEGAYQEHLWNYVDEPEVCQFLRKFRQLIAYNAGQYM
jgi:hypothetical protein